jgi:N-acetylmuramoyl-L-alanine amidase
LPAADTAIRVRRVKNFALFPACAPVFLVPLDFLVDRTGNRRYFFSLRNVSMASIDETKAQLLRGIVQDNINGLRQVRVTRIKRRKSPKPFWLGAGLVAAATTSLMVTWSVIPKPHAPAVSAARAHVGALVDNAEPAAAQTVFHPRPIDRGTIPLSIKTVVIDPGHGGEPGTTSESGITEKEITLDVARRLRLLLKDAPFKVLLTRETDRSMSLDKRVSFANDNKADLFLSIHVNWMEPHSIRALETFYVGATDDPATLKLASRENKDSGYSLSDYKKILEKIYVDVRRDESRALAYTIQNQLVRSLKGSNPELENRGVKTAPFVVLIGTQMPAILVEIACLSNEDEAALLTTEDYRENIALALAKGIRSYANGLKVADRTGS